MRYLYIVLAGIAIVLGGYIFFQQGILYEDEIGGPVPTKAVDTSNSPEPHNDGVISGMISYQGQVLAGTGSPLLVYSKIDYEKALSTGKPILLYFYANWCPECKAEFPIMESVFNEITGDEIVGFRVNFNDNETDDDERAIAKQFQVPYQHTKVGVKDGIQVFKSPQEWSKAKYLEEINNLMK